MNKRNTAKQQLGFFDLGFSLAILALSGAFAYTATPEEVDKVAVQEPQVEVVATRETGNHNVDFNQ